MCLCQSYDHQERLQVLERRWWYVCGIRFDVENHKIKEIESHNLTQEKPLVWTNTQRGTTGNTEMREENMAREEGKEWDILGPEAHGAQIFSCIQRDKEVREEENEGCIKSMISWLENYPLISLTYGSTFMVSFKVSYPTILQRIAQIFLWRAHYKRDSLAPPSLKE